MTNANIALREFALSQLLLLVKPTLPRMAASEHGRRDDGVVVSFVSWRETVPGISPVPEAVAAKTVARKGHDEWQRSDAAKRPDGSAASRKGEGGGGVGEPRATTENSGGGSDDQREVAVDETRGVRLVVV
eukprot:CAMPEP_0113537930 /NCGR_PEP_ID=MMETSP0015_2-20120614/7095_1 /TAXON_ID=2838 /ORGANISM="Odontella" /LENGTH=130 /DNA_ID=CAMNT_0000437471 /DNA_START=186 /DNA_END=579 /DNA_ORIENTATION=- /assembly_acc=CAM_ASM_000160